MTLAEWIVALLLAVYPGLQQDVKNIDVYVIPSHTQAMIRGHTGSLSLYTTAFSGGGQEIILVSERAVEISRIMPKRVGTRWLASIVRVEVQYIVGLRLTYDESIVGAADTNTLLSLREAGLFDAINRERAAHNLEPLQLKPVLVEVARMRSQDMTQKGYFGHFHPDGISAFELLSAAGVTFAAGGENLAKVGGDTNHSVRSAIQALMRSPSHRDNILNPRYRYIGVGGVTGDKGVTIFTMIFTD